MIVVIDNGIGNFSSVIRMLEFLGYSAKLTSNPDDISSAEKLILPGVGSFDAGMKALENNYLKKVLLDRVQKDNRPILGICLGMQLLCRSSEEGKNKGLGLVEAKVVKFKKLKSDKLKIPHMGWNSVKSARPNSLLMHDCEDQRFYFVHSYYVEPEDPGIMIGMSNHGVNFCSAFQKKNIFGVQFHPEKSHRYGMDLLKKFAEL